MCRIGSWRGRGAIDSEHHLPHCSLLIARCDLPRGRPLVASLAGRVRYTVGEAAIGVMRRERTMAMNPALFKAYDVRGLVPEEWGPAEAEQIGRAIPPVLGVGQVCVGRDMRVSSPEIAAALIRGITTAGADVVDIGAVSSDALYFSVGKYGYESGVMVTASHNPAAYNGMKMCRANAIPVSDETGL